MCSHGGASTMTNTGPTHEKSPSELISERIAEPGDWRGDILRRACELIKEADPEIVEEWKWRGAPVCSHKGIVCTGESYRSHVKLTFAKGASLEDPAGLFNASMDGNVRRAIDIYQGDKIDEQALKNRARAARRSSSPLLSLSWLCQPSQVECAPRTGPPAPNLDRLAPEDYPHPECQRPLNFLSFGLIHARQSLHWLTLVRPSASGNIAHPDRTALRKLPTHESELAVSSRCRELVNPRSR